MFEKLAGIKLEGNFFEEETTLKFFNDNKRFAVVYGENGSGKSSIADGFTDLTRADETKKFTTAKLIDKNDTEILETNNKMNENIYVFNEDYINTQIKMCSGGLDTITLVSFGKQVDILEQIEKLEQKKTDSEIELTNINKTIEKFKDKKDLSSHLYYSEKMQETLRNDGWANNYRIINENRTNPSVSEPNTLNKARIEPQNNSNL